MIKFLEFLFKYPRIIVSIYFFFGIISANFALNNLQINTSTNDLINNQLDFKINQKKLKDSFNILDNNILIRVKTSNQEKSVQIGKRIINELNLNKAISFVYSPNFDEIFKKNFFLFLNDSEKENLIQKLYSYQPFLSQINNHENKLEGFNNLIELSFKNNSHETLAEFENIFESFTRSLTLKKNVDWKGLLSKDNDFFILFGVKENYLKNNGFKKIYNFLSDLKSNENHDIKIDFTGGLIIDYEEIKSVSSGSIFSGLLSFILVGILLWIAIRNLVVISSILFVIFLGLIITIGITTYTIGSLNLISVAFAVLFIGLSVDYAIQVCSRISEKINFKKKNDCVVKVYSIYKTLLFASIPSIIGFLSFIPTDYIGLSELGMISAIGLIVGFIINITLLPSLLLIFPDNMKYNFLEFDSSGFINLLFRNQNILIGTFAIILLFVLFNLKKVGFDSDALNLKDQKLQSVKLAKELVEKNPTSDYVVSIILDKKEIKNFDESHQIFVDENVKSFFTFSKIFQEYKSEDLEYLKFLLSKKPFIRIDKRKDEITRFKRLLYKFIENDIELVSKKAEKLKNEILALDKEGYSSSEIQHFLFNDFDEIIIFIEMLGLIPNNIRESVPQNFQSRYISETGMHRVEIFPEKDLSKPENLKKFVLAVENFFPNATGMPIIQFKAGKVVINSFMKAFIISMTFLTLFLLLIFKNLKTVLICLFSLISAFILTIFWMILLNIDLNFANMIALPLLFTLGISYPIYFLKRYEELKDIVKVYKSNTPSAILFSGLTTMFSFGTLYLSSHQGTSSMGILLFLSLLNTLISSLIFLPILIHLWKVK